MATLKLTRPMNEWRLPMGMHDLTQEQTTAALHYANRMQRHLKVHEKIARLAAEGYCDIVQGPNGTRVRVIGEFSYCDVI